MNSISPSSSVDTLQMAGAAAMKAKEVELGVMAGGFEQALADVTRLKNEGMENQESTPRILTKEEATNALEQLREQAQALEGYIINMLMKKMRGTANANELFGNSPGHRMFSEMRDETYAKEMSKQGAFGLAKMIEEQYLPFIKNKTQNVTETEAGKAL